MQLQLGVVLRVDPTDVYFLFWVQVTAPVPMLIHTRYKTGS